MSDSPWPHGLQHTRLPRPSLSPRVCSDSCPLCRWCHPTILSSVAPFSSSPQSFPALEFFPMSQLFAAGNQSIGASGSASKDLLLINENQVCQVKEFSAFLCMGRCKSLGSLKSSLWSWGAICGQYPVFSHPEFPQGLPLHSGEAQLLMTVKSLITDIVGHIPFLICIQNSNSTILQYKIKIKTKKPQNNSLDINRCNSFLSPTLPWPHTHVYQDWFFHQHSASSASAQLQTFIVSSRVWFGTLSSVLL